MTGRLPPALRHPDFRRYLAGRALTGFGAEMLTVAVGYQVYQLTRNPLDLGLLGLSEFLPFALLVLPAGEAADHFDRRWIVTGCYALDAACAALLLALTMAGLHTAAPVFAVVSLLGVAGAFSMPTSQALVPNLVPADDFSNAVAVNSSTMQIAFIAGPAVGGFVFLLGPAAVYAAVAVLSLVSAAMLLGLRSGGRSERRTEPMTVTSVLSGINFVRSRPVVLGSISLDLFAVLFGGAAALLPVYASDILAVGPTGLGLLRAAPAVGAALCGAVLASRPVTRDVGRWMFGGVAAFGLGTLVFALSRSFVLSLAALVVMGAADMVSMFIRHLLVQLTTPDRIRGRVSAVNAVFIGASNELGEFESGITAAWLGTVPAVVIGGLATIAVAVLWSGLFPSLRRLDRFPGKATDEERAIARSAATAEVSGSELEPDASAGSPVMPE
ncbi:MAG: MFS transporter [Chloroflexota bacterium]|nr:MFS transporter [Chloroflexota bacterium]